jgi:hypothetical protein
MATWPVTTTGGTGLKPSAMLRGQKMVFSEKIITVFFYAIEIEKDKKTEFQFEQNIM